MLSLQNLAGIVSVTKDVCIQGITSFHKCMTQLNEATSFHLDKISSVTIKSLADNTPLVATVKGELVFTAIITSVAGTRYYTPVTYQWDYGDGNTEISTEPSVIYSYSAPGSWNITLVATNNVNSAMFIGRIHVFKGWFANVYIYISVCRICHHSTRNYKMHTVVIM